MEHDALAADGAIVRIRAVAPSDRPDLAALYRRTSDENLYRRFLCAGRGGIDHEVDRLTRPDGDDHVAVIGRRRFPAHCGSTNSGFRSSSRMRSIAFWAFSRRR